MSSPTVLESVNTPSNIDVKRRISPTPCEAPKCENCTGACTCAVKKGHKRRWRSGTVAAREIKKLQNTTHLLAARAQIDRLVRTIAEERQPDIHFSEDAITALHEISEDFVVQLLQDANEVTQINKRSTLMLKDLQTALRMRRITLPALPVQNESPSEALSEAASEVLSEALSGSDAASGSETEQCNDA